MSVPAATSAKKSFVVNDASQDIPIFLRKTYHMVDTCDPKVCSWSEDGETFIVKHPKKFEKEIIPQFFKHSKFSSFVRQLNFYAFRKIKTNDSIRIDPALEAATANYWRFYHPKFQKGKPEWLQEIKRSSSTPRGSGAKKTNGSTVANNNTKVAAPDSVESSAALGKENTELKTEVSSLKERLNAMSKNIDMLTTLVKNVSIAQKTKTEVDENAEIVNENNKRAKTTEPQSAQRQSLGEPQAAKTCVPDAISSDITVPDAAPSMPALYQSYGGEIHGFDSFSTMAPIIKGGLSRESSRTSEMSDEAFVDNLLVDFQDDDIGGVIENLPNDPDAYAESTVKLEDSSLLDASPYSLSVNVDDANKNPPRDELMDRLSQALSLLPREIQELIVDRLIQAITSPKEIRESLQVTQALQEVVSTTAPRVPMSVPQSPRHTAASCDDSAMMTDDDRSTAAASVVPASAAASPSPKPVPNPSLPLAAATLAALLSQYGKEPKCTAAVVAATNTLIPVHV